MSVLPGVRQTRRSEGKQREQRSSDFTLVNVAIALICFCLGVLYGSGPQWSLPKEQAPSPLPFHLEQSVSRLARVGTVQPRRLADLQNRKKTAPSGPQEKYGKRRQAIRHTFLKNLTAIADVEAKFVVGRSMEEHTVKSFEREVARAPHMFMNLDVEECYRCLPQKSASFFMAVHQQYDADWVIKLDDDVYLSANRILLAVRQYESMDVDYVGCMKHGDVRRDADHRWYEPAWRLLGDQNSMSAYGSLYILRQRAISDFIVPNVDRLRYLANEDTTIGQWLLAFNATFFEDMRLCFPKCHPQAIAFSNPECTGLCNPEKELYELHKSYFCQRPVINESRFAYMKSYPGHERMDDLKVYTYNYTVLHSNVAFQALRERRVHQRLGQQ